MTVEYKQFQVTLVTQEPFRIGALQDVMSGIDNPVATVGGRAVVQGSSLKGALRANVEDYLIERYGNAPEMRPCIPTSARTLSDDEKILIQKGLYRPGGSCMYSQRYKSTSICPACYLFGAQGIVGFVRVPYLYTDISPESLYAVRIDRATGVVAEKTNREYQLVRDGVEFSGVLEVLIRDTARAWELGRPRPLQKTNEFHGDRWLERNGWNAGRIIDELIVQRLKSLNLLGGFKSKGCGKVSVTVTEA
jgi:CRISPR/Cas system CSM-associated protein Csm3 (group 7 of RAMP superfamily)